MTWLAGFAALTPALSAPSLIPDPGRATASVSSDTVSLSNKTVAMRWSVAGGVFKPVDIQDRRAGTTTVLSGEAFSIDLPGGSVNASSLRITKPVAVKSLRADKHAVRASERTGGREVTIQFGDPGGRFDVEWRGILRNGSNYVRQEVGLTPTGADLGLDGVTLFNGSLPSAATVGTVAGSPVVSGNLFVGVEHPMGRNEVTDGAVHASLPVSVPVRQGTSLTASVVLGVSPNGQMRRGFLNYLERERTRPYKPFLHYNSWYDLGYGNQFDSADAVSTVQAFGRELHEKRGVALSSFLFDDGWDDPKTLWSFNSGFPDGFADVQRAAEKYGAAPGVWMSPWGGYNEARTERVKYGKSQGFETEGTGFALSGPVYYQRFRDVCLQMMSRYGVNQFKFDGTSNRKTTQPNSPFGTDFEAMIHLIGEIRAAKPSIYINLTTGTWSSPFWLRYADSIWRGGSDHDFAGVGSDRQQWMTYRDSQTYANVVKAGPLFPITSLMLHGLIYAKQAEKLGVDPGGDFTDEVHSYFGGGTQLQEMYVTPALLKDKDWDVLAEAANWSQKNADTLVDTHWVGGDPAKLEVYGWAAWSPRKGILTLRNPSDKPQDISVVPAVAFDLPAGAPTSFLAGSPWKGDDPSKIQLAADHPHVFHLAPFQVITLEATAQPCDCGS